MLLKRKNHLMRAASLIDTTFSFRCCFILVIFLFLFLFVFQVQLCFMNGNHYDSVYPISHMRTAGVCQCECPRSNPPMYADAPIYTLKMKKGTIF